uniref:Uncharacterized protein n=1 Tax=Arundo donax TaxID=35708 RepID=A0A0A9BR52_ARUDO
MDDTPRGPAEEITGTLHFQKAFVCP